MESARFTLTDDLPPNPNPDDLPEEIYQAFAGLTLLCVVPFGNYGFWCPFVPEDEQESVEGEMSSADMVMLALDQERPDAWRWFHENGTSMAVGEVPIPSGTGAFMIVFPDEIIAEHHGPVAHDRAYHVPAQVA